MFSALASGAIAQGNTVELQWLEPDGSFTMDESNTFLSPQGFPPNTMYG